MRILSGILLIITAILGVKHGVDGLRIGSNPDQLKMATDMGVSKIAVEVMSALGIAVGIAVLFPRSFFTANLINAITIVLIMAFSLRSGNYKMALIEIPFLIIPLLLIYLGHPLKK